MTLDATDGVVEEVERLDTNHHVPRARAMDLLFRDTVVMAPLRATLLGMAPLAAVTRVTEKMVPLVEPRTAIQTQKLALVPRPPAPLRSAMVLRAMTADERFWYLCALGAGIAVAALVLLSAYIAGV